MTCGPKTYRQSTRDIEKALWETNESFKKVDTLAEQSGKRLPHKLHKRYDFEPPRRDAVPFGKASFAPCWYLLAFANQAIGVVVIPVAVLVTVIIDLLNPRMHRSCSVYNILEEIFVRIMGAVWEILGVPWLIITYLNWSTWTDLLEICLEKDYFVLTYWLENIYNPQLYFRNDKAVFLFGRAGWANKVHSLSGVPSPDESEINKRKTSMEMISKFSRETTDKACLKLLEKCYDSPDGVDLNWPSPQGYTVVMLAMQKNRIKSLEWLLNKQEADLDRQDHYTGNTGVHKLMLAMRNNRIRSLEWLLNKQDADLDRQDHHSGNTCVNMLVQQVNKYWDGPAATLLEMLVKDKRTNLTVLNFHGDVKFWGIGSRFRKPNALDNGATPYMLLPDGKRLCRKALEPKPSYDELLDVIKTERSPQEKCAAIYELIAESREDKDRSLHHLRVMDMLFCHHEGTPEELGYRHKQVFRYFLKDMILKSTEEHLEKDEVALLRWVYYQSAGPPGMKKEVARETYIGEFNSMVAEAEDKIEQRYGTVYKSLQSQEGADELFSIGKEVNYIHPKELKHSTFLKFPDFIRNLNGIQAVRDLHAVGAIQNSGDFCNLMQGRHRLFGDQPVIALFLSDPNNAGRGKHCFKEEATLWNSLILLWQICLQEKVQDEFNETMKGIADAVEGVEFMAAPGVKGYLRSHEKADEDYKIYEDIAACMRVIDGLRCSFVVKTASQNLAVGKLIEETFGVARTKNLHQPGNLNYADRKYNVVFESKTKVPGVDYDINVLCEVQILLKDYFEIKADGHLLYEFKREPEQKQPLNLRSSTRDAMNCVCACGKYWAILLILAIVYVVLEVTAEMQWYGCRVTECTDGCKVTQNYLQCSTCTIRQGCEEWQGRDSPYSNRLECAYFNWSNSSDSCTCRQLRKPPWDSIPSGFSVKNLPCSHFKFNNTGIGSESGSGSGSGSVSGSDNNGSGSGSDSESGLDSGSGSDSCTDISGWTDSFGDGCDWYANNPHRCQSIDQGTGGKTPVEACCGCQGTSPDTGSPPTSPPTNPPTSPPTNPPTGGGCIDISGWTDSYGDGCDWYANSNTGCQTYATNVGTNGLTPVDACCVCQ